MLGLADRLARGETIDIEELLKDREPLAAAILREGRHYRPAFTDLLVVAFAVLVGLSEYLASGYNDAQNLMFGTIASVAAPYFCARLLLDSPDMDEALARRLVLILAALAAIGFYEAKFAWNPFFGVLEIGRAHV